MQWESLDLPAVSSLYRRGLSPSSIPESSTQHWCLALGTQSQITPVGQPVLEVTETGNFLLDLSIVELISQGPDF